MSDYFNPTCLCGGEVKQGRKFCSMKCASKRVNHDKLEIEKILIKKNCKLIEIYTSKYSTYVTYKCSCGNEESRTLFSFKSNKGACSKCPRISKKRIPFEEIQKRVEIKTNFILLTNETEYLINHQKLKLQCVNGHIFYMNKNKIGSRQCAKCSYKNRSGENNINFKDGKFKERASERQKTNHDLTRWRKKVLNLKGFGCDICKTKEKIHTHHINGYDWDIENRFNPNNGIPICEKHHWEFHNKYGRGNNTYNQYEEYKRIKTVDFLFEEMSIFQF